MLLWPRLAMLVRPLRFLCNGRRGRRGGLSKWPSGTSRGVFKRGRRNATPPSHFLMVPFSSTVPSSMPYFLITLRSWSMSNSSVASLPANIMMDFFPPGCSPFQGINMNQHTEFTSELQTGHLHRTCRWLRIFVIPPYTNRAQRAAGNLT